MQTLIFRELELIDVSKPTAQVTLRIDCRSCTMKGPDCHRKCPQMTAVCSEEGKAVTCELLQKGRRARIHKDVNVTFGKFMGLVGEKEVEADVRSEVGVRNSEGNENSEFGIRNSEVCDMHTSCDDMHLR